MKKKIIIGIIITVILSLTAFGTIYAYQKETNKLDNTIFQGKYNLGRYNRNHIEDCDEHASQGEEDCLMSEERNRNNISLKKLNNLENKYECEEENRHQHRYEDRDSVIKHGDCEDAHEENRQFKNQGSSNRS